MQDSKYNQNESDLRESEYEYKGMDWVKTIIVIAILLGIAFALITWMKLNKPEAKKGKPPKTAVTVAAQLPHIQNYPIKITANGSVNASKRGNLTSEVSGLITQISPNFNNGGSFNKGEVLATIDSRNFDVAVTTANGNIATAKAQVAQARAAQTAADSSMSQAESNILVAQSNYDSEIALAEQAKRDWQRLGYAGEPNDLVLRKQQLSAALAQLNAAKALTQSAAAEKQVAQSQEQSAQAQIESAKASLNRARLDSARTKIKAPYSGTTINRVIEVGQYISPGLSLGEIFSNKGLEVRLPLSQNQFSQLNVEQKPRVELSSRLGGELHKWQAEVSRVDSVFDTTTRQINVTAKILDPISNNGVELKVGQYVNASIEGRIVEQAMTVPNEAIREGNYLFAIEDGVLRKKIIKIIWQDNQNAIIQGLASDTMVVTTSVGGAANGSLAKLIGEQSEKNKRNKSGRPEAQSSTKKASGQYSKESNKEPIKQSN